MPEDARDITFVRRHRIPTNTVNQSAPPELHTSHTNVLERVVRLNQVHNYF